MQWFKHDATANADAKLKKVRIKYGLEGYGLYWYCLELIAGEVSKDKLTFELEHDAEIISHDTGVHYERVNEMMAYMVDLGLFERDSGVVTCLKMAQRLDQSMTSNPGMRKIISDIKTKNHDGVMTQSGIVMQDKNRIEENREDKNNTSVAIAPVKQVRMKKSNSFKDFYSIYPAHRKGGTDATAWKKWKTCRLTDDDAEQAIAWLSIALNISGWSNSNYVPGITKFIEEKRWLTPLPNQQSTTGVDMDSTDWIGTGDIL